MKNLLSKIIGPLLTALLFMLFIWGIISRLLAAYIVDADGFWEGFARFRKVTTNAV